jgi:hypothetical protein
VITLQMRRSNPRLAPLAYVQLMCVFAPLLMVLLPLTLIALAAFRPSQAAESTQLLSDIARLILFWVVSTPMFEYVSMAIFALMDRSERPLFLAGSAGSISPWRPSSPRVRR